MINILSINDHLRLGTLDMAAFSATQGLIEKRDLEKKATMALLKTLFPLTNIKLTYTPEKKPFLYGIDTHISISHSHDKLAILVNDKESTGVDVELLREKVVNIKHKFLCDEELAYTEDNIERLTTLWAAKESVYKAHGLKGIDFAKDMLIEIETLNEDVFFGRLTLPGVNKRFRMKKEKHGNYILVYILNEVR
ncbi:MAG: 4'-phosphopantetheinyl transferase family protein [Bacteroidia bacterium]